MNKYDVILAGLLHDIGKFFEKANAKGTNLGGIEVSTVHHGITSGNFVSNFHNKLNQVGFDTEAVKEMVQRHHEYKGGGPASVEDAQLKYRPYCYIIDKADNISSSERLNTRSSDGNWQLRQLTNIFSLVAGQRYSQEAGIYGEVYNRVNSDNKLNTQATNQKMVESFIQEFDSLEVLTTNKTRESTQVERQQSFISKVDNLLKKYTWCYPSDTREYIRDISLYSHLQTTAMLAGVLYDDLTTNSEYKRGLESDKEALGWKFTEVSIKELRTESITIMQVHLANALELITSSTLADAQAIKAWIIKLRTKLESELTNKLGITSTNILCKTTTGFIVVVSNQQAYRVTEVIREVNSNIPQPLGNLALFFELAYSEVDTDTLASNNTGEIINNLAKSINRQYSDRKSGITYTGLESLLVDTSSNTWSNIEIAKVISVPEIVSTVKITPKQSELKDKLNSKALSLVKIRIDNYSDLVSGVMSKSFSDIPGYMELKDNNKYIGTICRLSTMIDQITRVVSLTMSDCLYLSSGTDGIVAITSVDRATKIASTHRRIISKQTAGSIETSIFIETVSGKTLEEAFRRIEDYESRYKTSDVIIYNGNQVDTDLFSKMLDMLNMVIESAALKSGKNNLYKFLEFISMYKQYCDTGDTSYLMFIPRFAYNASRNFNSESITNELQAYMGSKLDKLAKSSVVSKNDTELIVLGSLIYDALQIMKASGEE